MDQTFAAHASRDIDLLQKIYRHLFQDARTNAALDIGATALLKYDAIDAGHVKELLQEQTCGSAPDNRDLSTHRFPRYRCSICMFHIQFAQDHIAKMECVT